MEMTGVPGDEECSVMMRGMAVVLDILALLPDAEVVESCGSIEVHCGSFLIWMEHHDKDQESRYAYCTAHISTVFFGL